MDYGVVDTVVTERRQHKMGWMANIPIPFHSMAKILIRILGEPMN